ncbi:hypothetical protein Rmf_39770 [Roseomonas fluvialis]|uniref:Uncharacterized protein n=2 Tax=Roseomonas fluvialis TaxID=1750527 RepID=A0ABN6P9G3_9PROT|nr:hypothetical protein Rmf_39770 [Roseomonas fluvialis]
MLPNALADDAVRKTGEGRKRALAWIDTALGAPWLRIIDAPDYVGWRRLAGSLTGTFRDGLTPDPAFDQSCTLEILDLAVTRTGWAFTPGCLTVSMHALGRLVQRGRVRATAALRAAVLDLHDTLLRMPEATVGAMINARLGINPSEQRADLLLPGPAGGAWATTILLVELERTRTLRPMWAARTYLDQDQLDDSQASAVAGLRRSMLPDRYSPGSAGYGMLRPAMPRPPEDGV